MGLSVLQTALLAINTGRLRGVHKTFATQEDADKNGGTVGEHEEVVRSNNAHRNQLENLPLFVGACKYYCLYCLYCLYCRVFCSSARRFPLLWSSFLSCLLCVVCGVWCSFVHDRWYGFWPI